MGMGLPAGDDDIGPPPEGGREAWSCVAAAFFLLFTIFGFCKSFELGIDNMNLEVGLMVSHFVWNFAGILPR
jgi:hypothetical protein